MILHVRARRCDQGLRSLHDLSLNVSQPRCHVPFLSLPRSQRVPVNVFYGVRSNLQSGTAVAQDSPRKAPRAATGPSVRAGCRCRGRSPVFHGGAGRAI